MPRRKLKFAQGNYYHIYNRGANRMSIFRNDDNYRFALPLMKKYCIKFSVTIIAYCLMPNHYHWLLRQDSEVPAGLLPQRVFNAYSHAFNNANNRSGTLFEDRFDGILVDSDEYLHNLCRYIHANPVLHGIAAAPELWLYSNYLEWTGERQGTLVDRAFIAAHFHSPAAYRSWVLSYLTGQARLPPGLQAYLDELEQE